LVAAFCISFCACGNTNENGAINGENVTSEVQKEDERIPSSALTETPVPTVTETPTPTPTPTSDASNQQTTAKVLAQVKTIMYEDQDTWDEENSVWTYKYQYYVRFIIFIEEENREVRTYDFAISKDEYEKWLTQEKALVEVEVNAEGKIIAPFAELGDIPIDIYSYEFVTE